MLRAIRAWHTNPKQELRGSEIVSGENDPGLLITSLTTDNFPAPTEL